MSDMIKSLRSGADRAAFEAGKLMRLQRVQYEQKTREQQRREYVEQLGEAVWQLYAQGRVSDPELVSVCHQIQATTHQIGELQKAAASLRNEQAARPSKCLDCGHDVSAGDAFCPFCGTKTGAGDPQQAKPPLALICAGCRRPVRAEAVFCGHCGRRQAEPA